MLAMQEDNLNSDKERNRRPLKLLACSGSLDGGGSERQLWQLVCSLDRQRFAPEVFLLHKRGPYLQQLPGDVPVHAFDSQYPAPPRFPPGRISWLQGQQLRRLVQTLGIDVVYDRTFHMSMLTGWALPSVQPRVSVIVSPPSRDLPSSEHRFLRTKRWLLARAYRAATVTLCVSNEVADDAASYYGLQRERLTVLHNPVDVERVRRLASSHAELPSGTLSAMQSESRQVQDSPGALHVAVVGRFSAEKGHRLALESLKVFQESSSTRGIDLHLHFVGDGPLKAEMQALVEQWSLAGKVHFHGYQTNPYPFMAACNLVLVPSRYEGFPNVALEAMALGVPLLMTDYGPTARMIAGTDSSRAVLFPPGDSQQAAQALADRLRYASGWTARAVAAQDWIEREHTLGPWLEKMMNLLEQASIPNRTSRRA